MSSYVLGFNEIDKTTMRKAGGRLFELVHLAQLKVKWLKYKRSVSA